jgi:hypothetical protein
MRHVVMFSGGLLSWAAAKRVVERHGTADVVLLFTDTLVEDEDTYRFLGEAAADVGAPLVRLADGRTPWELFRDERMIGNNRAAVCSRVLKQEQARKWLSANRDPAGTAIYLGYDWNEGHRVGPAQRAWAPWRVECPMCEPPLLGRHEVLALLSRAGIRNQRLYELGAHHANCGMACVRGGQGQWLHLLKTFPERFAQEERQEQALREHLGKDVSILRDRRGGRTVPLTLLDLRRRAEAGGQCDLYDWGGCGCFVDPPEAETDG